MQLTEEQREETTLITQQVQYIAPDKQLVDTVAQKASQVIGGKQAIDQKGRWNFYKGLSGFMKVFVTLHANHMNRDE